jgi:GT2 family glycosyltransferase
MSYRVVIPSRNQENALACLKSIRENQPHAHIVVVVDESEEWPDMGFRVNPLAAAIPGLKPFVFARNVNLGINAFHSSTVDTTRHSEATPYFIDDIIILNDDTRLLTPGGFSALSKCANEYPEFGVISAAITGAVGNLEQIWSGGYSLRPANHHTLVFVCVYIRAAVLNGVGLLDESFTSYGYDDDDYCARVRRAGLKLGVFDGCVIEHGVLPSTYRSQMENQVARIDDLSPNLQRFIDKWGCAPEYVK